jgi:hypothetical protein
MFVYVLGFFFPWRLLALIGNVAKPWYISKPAAATTLTLHFNSDILAHMVSNSDDIFFLHRIDVVGKYFVLGPFIVS